MSALPLRAGAHRQRMLRAMGITPMRLRHVSAAQLPPAETIAADVPTSPMAAAAPLALVLPAGTEPRLLDLLGRAMQVGGAAFARAPRLEVVDGQLRQPPVHAGAYLAFGQEQARALGRALPVEVMSVAQVMLVEPPEALRLADGKRKLWSAMHALWRQVRRNG
ncbi:hypothetical protein [Oleiagrimonas sp. C23AA]|uniref:hypothetical protein n=1 Tax=Oleiagrimonas sp. C23AA TaxID=2719047 RepID=UPI001423B9DA|nr:hypothetical protein [Oleiagrimonas sp. C23AA]NII12014.1 hypothetical protein [Oleiagrimonas sp. C23AA]